ncbi:hypothetical protein ASPWEDRAFT_31226 [Aspergillus wentii DTO 134E9]|uniref:Histone deacetylase complex subunit SAP30 Sin3 binding domain-containing protein n=1 Tax=Aspergillus wentii DTO 134E9 TaxID=1073089 RepID=A0A1L9RBM4_ASPWE|nr:uncharacterized protein ASPWEDRAFT_31226 [Aspergillus wentii DTO 134E9]KAI9934871.1 hypothetical protein MW887_000491 [Aspergillus wentii]OJJ32310.1 hypothetical protein ASPWEDRAFT_31226 [Aspergillus wentii DTO 134E9]
MAPPRQRTTAVVDDSRSEASSGTREKTTTGKGRKAANGSLAGNSASNRENKAAANATSVTSAPAGQGEPSEDLPKIAWSDMPNDLLHSYRHAYRLPAPSAFSTEYSHLLLSKGIGLRSPTSIAAQRAQLSQQNQETNGSRPLSAAKKTSASTNGVSGKGLSGGPHNHHRKAAGRSAEKNSLNHIHGQGRVGKNQLAMAVRRHFNDAIIPEQEAIARFLYKVREEGRGRQFRLRFQP